MNRSEKTNLTKINKIKEFNNAIEKLSTDKELNNSEKSYLLSCAILFMRYYENDKRYASYLDFSYYIILKYSITYNDYQPLYDFATNFGFYPIAKNIIAHELLDNFSINDCFLDIQLDKFKSDNYIETYEQNKTKRNLLNDESDEICYVAPTSFGKSSIIVEHIRHNNHKKIGIIVPTKSLLMQTYKMIRHSGINKRIIIHDEMYNGEDELIAVFTQERALRLIHKGNIAFDILYIDEAHNLFKFDRENMRSILLSRLIRKNSVANPNQQIIYLSPLISDCDNLKIDKDQHINLQKINFNVKEPEIYEYRLDNHVYYYNRFVNTFYPLNAFNNELEYIQQKALNKNFIYLYTPKSIETFTKQLCSQLEEIDLNEQISEFIENLKNNVHKNFIAIEFIKRGVIYLHGKLPDMIKEYIESKFSTISELKFVIANSVILEGMNLPIDTLFILNTYALQGKELTNLIGRVNRLNKIFIKEKNELNKLLPKIHFVNTEEFNRANSNMSNKIELLRNRSFTDTIKNPTLEAFDSSKLNEEKLVEINLIRDHENFITEDVTTADEKLKQYIIENGIALIYDNIDLITSHISNRIKSIESIINKWDSYDMLDKIYYMFIEDIENTIKDFEFSRLKNEKARRYYEGHIKFSHSKSLKFNINSTYNYFKELVNKGETELYIGNSFGEIAVSTESYENPINRTYVDLTTKSDSELINLAIVKFKLESDFISFKLNKFIVMLYDYNLISEDDYHLYIYGTKDKQKIKLTKLGLSCNLLSRLEQDNQLENIYFDENNNIKVNEEFNKYRDSVDDFYRFELSRFL